MMDVPPGSNLLIKGNLVNWMHVDSPVRCSLIIPSKKKVPFLNADDETSSDNECDLSSTEANWEVLGEDLLIPIPEEHKKKLARIFPGVKEVSQSISVDGNGCSLCAKELSPDDAIIDHYDGQLYCSNCHQGQYAIIPRDVIESWDFVSKPVSIATKFFIDSISAHPMISLTNPSLFANTPVLAEMRHLRQELCLLWSLLARCSQKTCQSLVSLLARQTYLLGGINSIDTYSLSDLIAARTGDLKDLIEGVLTKFVQGHVIDCIACRRWTLVCDVCRDINKPIWPQTFTQFRRCYTQDCKRVMHCNCLTVPKPPPPPNMRVGVFEIHLTTLTDVEAQQDSNQQQSLSAAESRLATYCIVCQRNLRLSQIIRVQ